MADSIKIKAQLIINGLVVNNLPDVDIPYSASTDMDIELELVHGPGGPILRPKTPPRL